MIEWYVSNTLQTTERTQVSIVIKSNIWNYPNIL